MTEASSSQPQWMIRRTDMRIFRPIPQSELIQKIESGEISPGDELCPANGYWFMLSEVNEVRRFLGDIDLSCLSPRDHTENTSSTDTRPIQKTSVTPLKIVVENLPTLKPAPKKKWKSKIHSVSEVLPDFEQNQELKRRRAKNAIGVALAFLVFIVVLVLFWSGSY